MKMMIGSEFVSASSGDTIPVINPYNGNLIERIPHAGPEDVDRAIQYAADAQKLWKNVPVFNFGSQFIKMFVLLRKMFLF